MASRHPQIQFLGLALKAELESGGASGRLFADSLAAAMAIRLISRYNGFPPPMPEYPGGLSSSALRRVIEYIQDNLHADLSLAEACRHTSDEYDALEILLQAIHRMAPHQYIIAQRVERASSLLRRGDLTPGQVAVLVGFYDQSHLNRHFKRLVGVTPGDYKRSP